MRIAKPILLVSTPVGVVAGLYEAYRLAGGLVLIMAAMLGVLSTAAATVVATIRREQAEAATKRDQTPQSPRRA
jgi:hypothetical protein